MSSLSHDGSLNKKKVIFKYHESKLVLQLILKPFFDHDLPCLTFQCRHYLATKYQTYHIRIIPVSWSSNLLELCGIFSIEVNDANKTVPSILNISIVPPQVTVLSDQRVVGLVAGGVKMGRNE